jgi:predicted nucleotidyltransferase
MSAGFSLRSREQVNEIAIRYGQKLQATFERVEIRLFGSYLRDTATDQSDLDLAIISRDFLGIDPYMALKILNRMKIGVDSIIEPIALTPDEFNSPDVESIAFEVCQ